MTIVLRIILPITVTKRQVVKAVPWIKTVSGSPGIRSALLCQVGTGTKSTHSKSCCEFLKMFVGFNPKSVVFSVKMEQIVLFNDNSFGMTFNL